MAGLTQARFETCVDVKDGTVDRAIFSDAEIYKLEQERIFARCWNFMCHESQIEKPGDFFLNFIGEESVIATRDRTGKLQVFLNSCRHRGNAVCRAESGNARAFLCTYHGWTYGLDGKLMGVPGFRELYHEELDRDQWGLISAGKVESYRGFVFATMDPDAPSLVDYLGEVGRMGLDLVAARGDMVVLEGIQKNVIDCNWKIAVDNIVDWYHVDISHASALMAGFLPRTNSADENDMVSNLLGPKNHRVVMGDYGHMIGGPRIIEQVKQMAQHLIANPPPGGIPRELQSLIWRLDPEKREDLGPVGADVFGHPNIFPSLWIASFGTQLCLRLPKGPDKTELWWFTFIDRNASPEERAAKATQAARGFGPAGMLEQDDGENWEQSSRATRGPIARRYPLNYQMNLGRGEVTTPPVGPSYIDAHVSEHAQLWMYRAWADWMDAADWKSLRQHRTVPPTGTV